jgi:hypothetical protein
MMSASTALACARATSGEGVQNAPNTGLSLSIRASTASVTSVGESCLVRIFSTSVTASMRQMSFAGTAAAAGVAVAPIAPPTTAAAPAAAMSSRRDTPFSAPDVPAMGFLLVQCPDSGGPGRSYTRTGAARRGGSACAARSCWARILAERAEGGTGHALILGTKHCSPAVVAVSLRHDGSGLPRGEERG